MVARDGIEPPTRDFLPVVPGLCVTNGRQLNAFKRLEQVWNRPFSRFEPIRTNRSGKVVTKSNFRICSGLVSRTVLLGI